MVWIFLGVGLAAGFLAGLFGVGGGILTVPALLLVFTHMGFPVDSVMHMAEGTTLCIMIGTATSSAWAHRRNGNIDGHAFAWITPCIVVGTIGGASLAGFVPTHILRVIFGVYLAAMSVKAFLGFRPVEQPRHGDKPAILLPWGLAIGFVAGLLGIGGGAMTVPLFSWSGLPMRRAAGTSSAITLPIALVGALTFFLAGWGKATGSETGYIYLPAVAFILPAAMLTAPVGAKITTHLPCGITRRAFAILLALLSIKMLWI